MKKIIFIIFILIVITGVFFTYMNKNEITEPFDCPSFSAKKEYNLYGKNQFGFNDEKLYFLIIDEYCTPIKNNSEYYFNEYFTFQYAKIINNTPKSKIDDIHTSIKLIKNIIDENLPETNNPRLNDFKSKLISQLDKEIDPTNVVGSFDIVLNDYSNLYETSSLSVKDSTLSEEEIEEIQRYYVIFIYDSLNHAGLINDVQNVFTSNLGIFGKFFIGGDWIFGWWSDSYREKKKELIMEGIHNFLFEKPINFLHSQMLKEI